MPKYGPVDVNVHGGNCRLIFSGPARTGTDVDACPGVSFTLVSSYGRMIPYTVNNETEFYAGMGVIGRSDLARLVEMFQALLAEYPVVVPSRSRQPNWQDSEAVSGER